MMNQQNSPKLIDISIKDGGFKVNHHILPEQAGNLARELERAGIEFAEISHGLGLGSYQKGAPALVADTELLQAARNQTQFLKILVFISSLTARQQDIEEAADYFDMGRIAINVDQVEPAVPHLKTLQTLKKSAMAQLMRVHHFKVEEVALAAKKLADQGADVIYLTDSYGSMGPQDCQAYCEAVKQAINIPLGFQSRNYTGRSVQNTLQAWQSGAEWLDASIAGFGRGAGITNLQALVFHLQRQKKCQNVNLSELHFAENHFALKTFHHRPYSSFESLMLTKYQIDYVPENLLENLSPILEKKIETIFIELKEMFPHIKQISETELEAYLKKENLDLQVVLSYLKSGEIPGSSPNEP